MKKHIMLFYLVVSCALWGLAGGNDTLISDTLLTEESGSGDSSLVFVLDIDGAIGTVTADRVIDAVELAEEEMAELLLITMDTPGGFNEAMWSITKAMMNSSVPVAVYVSPYGAKAASAGVYITYAAHIAAMAPGTNIGAAHVIAAGGAEIDSVMMEKIMNDAVASLKAMAERNGRNAEWAEKAARESVSITSKEALKLNVIDLIADDVDTLLAEINGREINTVFGKKVVKTTNPKKVPLP